MDDVQLSADGRYALIADIDDPLRLWDLTRDTPVREFGLAG